jgi:hypothetical protein
MWLHLSYQGVHSGDFRQDTPAQARNLPAQSRAATTTQLHAYLTTTTPLHAYLTTLHAYLTTLYAYLTTAHPFDGDLCSLQHCRIPYQPTLATEMMGTAMRW